MLTVYLEGDGFAWRSVSQPSLNPTPINPIGLQLALAQPQGNAVYLARPCQYSGAKSGACAQRYWTHSRFAREVVEASHLALEQLKQQYAAERLILVGYSGGGTLAALLAAQRDDVQALISVASPLDHAAWTSSKKLSPLSGSLNPAEHIQDLQPIPQWHLVGSQDNIVPAHLAHSFVALYAPPHGAQVLEIPGLQHQCCWVEHWPNLWRQLNR